MKNGGSAVVNRYQRTGVHSGPLFFAGQGNGLCEVFIFFPVESKETERILSILHKKPAKDGESCVCYPMFCARQTDKPPSLAVKLHKQIVKNLLNIGKYPKIHQNYEMA